MLKQEAGSPPQKTASWLSHRLFWATVLLGQVPVYLVLKVFLMVIGNRWVMVSVLLVLEVILVVSAATLAIESRNEEHLSRWEKHFRNHPEALLDRLHGQVVGVKVLTREMRFLQFSGHSEPWKFFALGEQGDLLQAKLDLQVGPDGNGVQVRAVHVEVLRRDAMKAYFLNSNPEVYRELYGKPENW